MALTATGAAIRRLTAAQHRLQAGIARDDKRAWVVKRRERTRHLIELGGLVVKPGLVELTDDDRAAMFGLMVEGAATLRSERGDDALALWRRRGKRAFALAADNERQP
ncbi:conjugal transfer protein TraD [Sphingomonas sp. PB4P5]|uniref:conjugal transfer protein TraD n=1 Tax=Parasphingomonas puruogangriensis TaxID=3096155 RepID=UPI002FC998D0